jgi:hypothetical protein
MKMMNLADIIDYKYGKQIAAAQGSVTIHGNDYEKMEWAVPGVPKPSLAELQGFEVETENYMKDMRTKEQRASRMYRKLPEILDVVLDALLEIDSKQPNLFSQNLKKRLNKASKVLNEVDD